MAVPTTPEKAGSLVGAAFGLAFVVANSGSLPDGVALALRGLAVVLFRVVAVRAVTTRSSAPGPTNGHAPRPDCGFLLTAALWGVGVRPRQLA